MHRPSFKHTVENLFLEAPQLGKHLRPSAPQLAASVPHQTRVPAQSSQVSLSVFF